MKSSKGKLSRILMGCIVLISLAIPVLAQGTTDGTIAGTVTDPRGAVVPNASVTAKNNATSQTYSTVTAGNGTFRLNNIPVGQYTVTIEAPSFKKYANPSVTVQLNRVVDVNASLEPGELTETVTVTATATELIEKTTSQLSNSFDSRKTIDLPIGQDVNALALLQPGVVNQGAGVLGAGGSVGGNRGRNNSFNIDGIDNNDISVTGPQIQPIQDSVQEFSILTNVFSAEFGHSSAGQFNTITKTGTNQLHGGAWYYNSNKTFNALDHRFIESESQAGRNGDQVKRPRFDFNRVGGDLGGPIIKDRLFAYGAYEYQATGTAGSSQTFGAPTAEGFAKLQGLVGKGASPFVLTLLRDHVSPAPAATGTVNVLGQDIPFGQLLILVPNFNQKNQFNVNVDYVYSARDQLRGRFDWDRVRAPNTGTPGPEFNGSFFVNDRLFSLTETHTFSPQMINEFRFGYRRQTNGFGVRDQFADFPGQFPNIEVDELGLFIGPNGNSPQSAATNVYQYVDNLSWNKDRHQMKFGIDYRNAIAPSDFLPRARGEYDFGTLEELLKDVKPTGSNGGLRGVGSGFFAGNQWSLYGFAQDDFKFRPNLTFNLGIRYEYTSNARDVEKQNLNALSSVPAGDPILRKIGLFPNGIIFRTPKTDKNNWAPRVGFAWAPQFENTWLRRVFGSRNDSSIRGGFGIAYDVVFQNLPLLQLPPQLQQEVDASSGSGGAFGSNTQFLQQGGIPTGVVPREIFTDKALARSLTQSLILDSHVPYTESWSLAIQRQFKRDWSVEARYVGSRAVHEFVQSRLNAGIPPSFHLPTFLNPSEIPSAAKLATLPSRKDFLNARRRAFSPLGFFSNFTEFTPNGDSTYHGVSFEVKRRFSRGLTLDGSYTVSKTIDNSTNELFSSFVNPRRPQDPFNLRAERAESVLSHPQRFVFSWIWELPLFQHAHGLKGLALGNWQISGVYQAESGQLVTPLNFTDSNGNFDSAGDRPIINSNGDPRLGSGVNWVLRNGSIVAPGGAPSSQVVGYIATNPKAKFIKAERGALSNAGRNLVRAPGMNNWDLGLFKRFPIMENKSIEFRAEMFNAFNHPQFFVDDSFALDFVDVSGSNFLNSRRFSGKPRFVQLQLRFRF